MSEGFAGVATQCTGRLVSVGLHGFRCIDREQDIFSLILPVALA